MSLQNISEEEVLKAQEKWRSGVINIGKKFLRKEDYFSYANTFLDSLYAFNMGDVLFKPTLASEIQFRLTKKAALSYFIGGNDQFKEDEGFAIKGWTNIRWENAGYKIYSDIAVCMGNYFFSIDNSEPLKVEFTIVLKKIDDRLRLILHDSHLPFQK